MEKSRKNFLELELEFIVRIYSYVIDDIKNR